MPNFLVLIMGVLIGYVAFNFGTKMRRSTPPNGSNGDDVEDSSDKYLNSQPITLAESIRRKVAETLAEQAAQAEQAEQEALAAKAALAETNNATNKTKEPPAEG